MTASITHLPLPGRATLPQPPAAQAGGDDVGATVSDRDVLLDHLAVAIDVADDAARQLDILRSPAVWDPAVAEGRDGRDMAAHLDSAIRSLRAAMAVGRLAFDKAAR